MAPGFQRGDPFLKPLKWYKSLSSIDGRKENGVFLAEGRRTISQIAATNPDKIIELLADDQHEQDARVFSRWPTRLLSVQQLKSIASTQTPQGLIAVIRFPSETYDSHLPPQPGSRLLLLEDIQDPGNIGTLLRTAAALGYGGAILSGHCADPFSPKAVQASAGAVTSLWIRRTDHYLDLVNDLKKQDYRVVAADVRGSEDRSWAGAGNIVIALGNEGSGLTEKVLCLADCSYRIPMNTLAVESLNVAASGAICMFIGAGT